MKTERIFYFISKYKKIKHTSLIKPKPRDGFTKYSTSSPYLPNNN
jgi:hypothetical protein